MKGDIFHDPLFLAGLKKGGAGGSASGDIVTFNAPKAAPLRSLRIDIDPVQDLHGYDSPWPGGGGKNKFNVDAIGNSTYITVSNGVITVSGNSRNPSKKLSDLADLVVGETYVLTASTTGTANYIYLTTPAESWYFGQSRTISQNDLNSNVLFYAGGADVTANISAMMIRLSSVSDASYAPYSNICPISGWSAANLWRTGKNLAKLSSENAGDNQRSTVSYTDSGAVVTATGTYGRYGWQIPVKTGSTYTISYKAVASDAGNNNKIYFGSKTAWSVTSDGFLSWQKVTTTEVQYSVTVTIPSDTLFIGLYVSGLGTSGSITISDLQLELSSTATTYAPYTGNQITIQLGQTVYGGTLDVVNGVLTVDRANIASYNGETLPGEWISDRDVYAPGTTPTIGAQVVYELATPITIPLSDITISTLAGQNVVWADCGDVAVEWAGGKGFGKEAMLAWVMNR